MAVKTGVTVVMEGVDIFYMNFEGKEGQYNKEGDRNFAVGLPEDVAEAMAEDGWNIKRTKVRDEDLAEDPNAVGRPWLPVAAEYRKGKPPKVVMITSRGKTILGEDNIALLDSADIQNCDLIVAASNWEVNGNTGVKAYLRSMFVTIEEDELERKYAEMDSQ